MNAEGHFTNMMRNSRDMEICGVSEQEGCAGPHLMNRSYPCEELWGWCLRTHRPGWITNVKMILCGRTLLRTSWSDVQSRSSLTKVRESCSSQLLFPSRKSRASAISENLDAEVAVCISLYTFACISPRLITNNYSVAISGKTLDKTDANFRKIKSGVYQKRLRTKCKPKLARHFTGPKSDQMTCEVPGYGPYRLRPPPLDHDRMKRGSVTIEAETNPAHKFMSAPLKTITAMISWEAQQSLAASTEPKHRPSTCLPRTSKKKNVGLELVNQSCMNQECINNKSYKQPRKIWSRSVFLNTTRPHKKRCSYRQH